MPERSRGLLRVLGWPLWGVYLAAAGASLALQARAGTLFGAPFTVGEAAILLLFSTTGLVILRRQPSNRIAWIFLLLPLGVGIERLAGAYATVYVTSQPRDVLGALAVWTAGTYWPSGISIVLLMGYLPILYPDGRPPTARWRVALYALPLVWALQVASVAFEPGRFDAPFDRWANPFGMQFGSSSSAVVLRTAGNVVLPLLLLLGVSALVVRWRRSSGVERQQLKWFLYAVFVLFLVMVVNTLVPLFVTVDGETLGSLLFLGAIMLLPLALGVAILRHRLYDIDRIVSRTASYALLTALLVGVYATGVVGGGALVRSLTGGSGGNLVVAASTLAAAGLFGPARRRIQRAVDRRFNRSRYDAARTVEALASRLRDEVDLDMLAAEIREATRRALQPAHVGVWTVAVAGGRPDPDTGHVTVPERPAGWLSTTNERIGR